MTRIAAVGLGLLLLVGCGASGGGPGDQPGIDPQIVGSWELIQGSGALFADFSASGTFTYGALVVVDVNAGTINADYSKGSYATSGGDLTMMATEATCPGAASLLETPYVASGNQMTWTDQSTTIVFSRIASSGMGSAVITNGCLKNGVFTPSPLAPI